MRSRWIGTALSLLVVSGCMGVPTPTVSPSPNATLSGATSPTVSASTAPRSPAPAATPEPTLDPIAGIWRVRKVLAPGDRSALLPDAAYADQAFVVTAGCEIEPCPTVEVRITPLARAKPVTVAVLERDGDRYVSAAQAENEGPCLNGEGDRVQGGATATSTLRLWAATVRASGTAVEQTALVGSLTLELTPTSVGSAAGCQPQSASYDLTGRREAIAVRTKPLPEGDLPPNTAGGLANLPSLSVEVSGVKIAYFPIEGDTVTELGSSLADGGLEACGAINYEWHEGDTRPAACAITGFGDIEAAIDQRGSGASCTMSDPNVRARFTIHFPRWTVPNRVPKRLLAWWRDVVEFIRDHEAGHITISRAHVKRLNADLRGAKCEDANSIIRRWSQGLSDAQSEYDRLEYQKPWPAPPFGY